MAVAPPASLAQDHSSWRGRISAYSTKTMSHSTSPNGILGEAPQAKRRGSLGRPGGAPTQSKSGVPKTAAVDESLELKLSLLATVDLPRPMPGHDLRRHPRAQ